MKNSAVSAEPPCLEMLHPFAAPDPFDNLNLFVRQIRRNDTHDGLSDHLLRGIAKHPFGSRIPARDDAFKVLGNNGIVRVLHDRGKILPGKLCWICPPSWHRNANYSDILTAKKVW